MIEITSNGLTSNELFLSLVVTCGLRIRVLEYIYGTENMGKQIRVVMVKFPASSFQVPNT